MSPTWSAAFRRPETPGRPDFVYADKPHAVDSHRLHEPPELVPIQIRSQLTGLRIRYPVISSFFAASKAGLPSAMSTLELAAKTRTAAPEAFFAIGAFSAARKVAHDSQPERIFADKLNAYPQAMTYWEGESKPELVARMGVGKPHANNNRIERLNGTLRERVKVQRGWKSMKTALAEGARIHYNFVKPHQALAGQTPAQVAGIGLEGKNRWLELLENSLRRDSE